MAKKNLTAYECIYISKYHFSSAEFLLLSSNPFTFFSAGFLYHLSFELLLKGLITLEGKKYVRIHSLEKLIKNLNGKKQKDVNKIITKETLYGQHLSYCQMLCMKKIRQHIFSHLSYRY